MPCMVKFSVIVDFGHPLISVYGTANQKAEICNKIKATQHLPPADDMSFSKLLCSKFIALHPSCYRQMPNLPIKPKISVQKSPKSPRDESLFSCRQEGDTSRSKVLCICRFIGCTVRQLISAAHALHYFHLPSQQTNCFISSLEKKLVVHKHLVMKILAKHIIFHYQMKLCEPALTPARLIDKPQSYILVQVT